MKNLTEGNVRNVLWKFSIPMFVSVIFQQLYSIADSVIAGRFAGEDALAAVGASYPITMIFMAVAVGSNIGCSVVISNLFGAEEYRKVRTAATTTIIASIVLSIILTVIGLFGNRFLMKMIQTPENIFADGALYLKVYLLGFLFLFVYNVVTGIFSALGDSNTPLYLLIGSSVGNILLDYIFVAQFHWGVAGVAWATFIAQGVSCILSFILLKQKMKTIKMEKESEVFSMSMLKQIGRVAIPSILQQSFISVGNIFIQGLVNSYGSSVIAGYSAAIKLNTFTITSFTTLGNGMSNFTGQNIGAGKEERVKKGFVSAIQLAIVIAIPFFFLYFFGGNIMIKLFVEDGTKEALHTGEQFLKIVSPFYFIVLIKLMADSVLRGGGAMKEFMVATFADLILRVLLSFILSAQLGSVGIWLSWPIGWSIATVFSVSYYLMGKWKSSERI